MTILETISNFLLQHIYLDYTLRILGSFLCGICLGLERKIRNHAVGVRTLVLMSISSAALSIVSIEMANAQIITGDPTRIAAGVITGIGFIGGGAILRQGFNIRGITTAAIIFIASGIGISFGAGQYFTAILTFILAILSLLFFEKLEHKIFPAENTKVLHFEFDSTDINEQELVSIIKNEGMIILDTDIEYSSKKEQSTISYMVKTPKTINYFKMAKNISKMKNLTNFSMSKK